MFDTYVHERTEYVPYEKEVHIHRAPTDKSVELLNEMQEKAYDNILKTIKVEDNTLNAIVVIRKVSLGLDEHPYTVKFSLNGKEYRLDGVITYNDMDGSKYGSSAISVAIARQLCYLFAEAVFKESERVRESLRNNPLF